MKTGGAGVEDLGSIPIAADLGAEIGITMIHLFNYNYTY